jgi:hypothetical protein
MASWNHDGTQDPGPPPLMTDPLSGLVTGGKYEGEAVRVRVVEPAAPDIEKVRTAMESVLDENSELRVDLLPGAPPKVAARKPAAAPTEKLATPPVGIPVAQPRQGAVPAEIPPQRSVPPPRTRWSPGLTAVGLLLLVMAVLAIVMLASLIDTIASLFS